MARCKLLEGRVRETDMELHKNVGRRGGKAHHDEKHIV